MVRYFFIAMIFLSACNEQVIRETIVVDGKLYTNERISDIHLSVVRSEGDVFLGQFPLSGAEVSLLSEAGELIPLEESPSIQGKYLDPVLQRVVLSGETYTLQVRWEGKEAKAMATIPPELELLQVSTTTIPINPDSPNEPIFTVIWDDDDDLSHVLSLNVTEDSPSEIPFDVPSGNFDANYRFPLTGQGATLLNTDFEFYGEHNLTIYGLDQEYEALFFYQPGEAGVIIDDGPENIVGGAGYFVGLTRVKVALDLIE